MDLKKPIVSTDMCNSFYDVLLVESSYVGFGALSDDLY